MNEECTVTVLYMATLGRDPKRKRLKTNAYFILGLKGQFGIKIV